MSIVITVLDGIKKKIFMMGDLRAVTPHLYLKDHKRIDDNVEKVLKLNETLFLGITGNLQDCKDLYIALLARNSLAPSEIIQTSKSWIMDNPDAKSSFIISGKFDNGQLFAFYPDSNNFKEVFLVDGYISYVILTHKLKLNSVFEKMLKEGVATELAMRDTIKYASERDETICSGHTLSIIN